LGLPEQVEWAPATDEHNKRPQPSSLDERNALEPPKPGDTPAG
jgi:hypothetical protein